MNQVGLPGGPRALSPDAIGFDRVPVGAFSSRGTPYTRWVSTGMPHLGPYAPFLKAVLFLYPSVADAEAGTQAGGTGFLVGVRGERVAGFHVHAVTNYHVAVFNKQSPPSPVVRVNTLSGAPDTFDFDPSEWTFQQGGPDIAISPILMIVDGVHDYTVLDAESWLMSEQDEREAAIGAGEDVFMMGRFVDYDGVETNMPAARFGHISMMDARIEQTSGYRGRSIVLDMHSRSGFSGSPVVVYRTLGSHFLNQPPNTILGSVGHYIKILGIHYAQFPEAWELKAKPKNIMTSESVAQADAHYIEGLSGMTCVVPAAEIKKLIYHPELIAMRKSREDQIIAGGAVQSGKGPKPEVVSLPATDVRPTHREDFTRLLGAAVRTQKPEE
jgi:hypothetical protein